MHYPPAGVGWEVAVESSEKICDLSCYWLSLMYLELSRTNLDKAGTPYQYECDMKILYVSKHLSNSLLF